MSGTKTEPEVKVGYLENLSPADRKAAEALRDGILADVRKEIEKTTDPATRPGFSSTVATQKAPVDKDGNVQIDFKRFAAYQPEKANRITGDILSPKSGGFLPPGSQKDGACLSSMSGDERTAAFKSALEAGFNINLFPRGDINNFSVTRWAAASERAQHTLEGGTAFKRWAPWESQYYYACEQLGLQGKAMGDMVSGSIPGRAV